MIDPIGGSSTQLVRVVLDAYVARSTVLAQNVANANTADYRPLQLDFEGQLARVAEAIDHAAGESEIQRRLDQLHPRVVLQPAGALSGDASLRLDAEMAALAGNTVQYQALIGAFGRQQALLRLAIGGEGG